MWTTPRKKPQRKLIDIDLIDEYASNAPIIDPIESFNKLCYNYQMDTLNKLCCNNNNNFDNVTLNELQRTLSHLNIQTKASKKQLKSGLINANDIKVHPCIHSEVVNQFIFIYIKHSEVTPKLYNALRSQQWKG